MPKRALTPTKTPGIFRRGTRYVVVMRDTDGRQFKRAAATLSDARQLQAALRTEVSHHTPGAGSRLTFAQYAEEWCATYSGRTSRGIRPLTLRDYRRSITKNAVPYFGKMRLSEIQPRDIKGYAAACAEKGMSNNTVRLRLAPLRALFATAFEDGLIRANPAAGLRNVYGRRRQDEAASKALNDTQLASLLASTPNEHQFLISFLVETGLRIGELVALRWQEVDLVAGRMRVVRRYYQGTMDTPKSRFGTRTIPLTAPTIAALQDRYEFLTPEPEDFVFTSRAGTMLDPWSAPGLVDRVVFTYPAFLSSN